MIKLFKKFLLGFRKKKEPMSVHRTLTHDEQMFAKSVTNKAQSYLQTTHGQVFDEQKCKVDLQKMFYQHYTELYKLGHIWTEPEVKVDTKFAGMKTGYLISIHVGMISEGRDEVLDFHFVLMPKDKRELINTYLH